MVLSYNGPAAAGDSWRVQKNMLFSIDANEELNTQALRAKNDEAWLETFIRKNRNFILRCAYKTVHRFVTESDDEWSVALIAFHEAIQTYDVGKGNFKSFAALVIKRRLLDQIERDARRKNEIVVDITEDAPEDEEFASAADWEVRRAVAAQSMERDTAESAMRDEIEAAQQILQGYGFSFFDLAECSPKAQKTKTGCAKVINELLRNAGLKRRMRSLKTLPAKELSSRCEVPRKLLENHRKYIIAATELLDGDFPYLAEYLRFVKKGGESE